MKTWTIFENWDYQPCFLIIFDLPGHTIVNKNSIPAIT